MTIDLTIVVIVLGAFLIFFLIFRKDISALLHKIKNIGKDGISFKPEQNIGKAEQDPQKEAEELLRALDSQMLREQEDIIRSELKNRSLTGDKACEVLTRYLAATQIAHAFEVLYQAIWGSQIKALENLNSQLNGFSKVTMKLYYDEAAKKSPHVYDFYSFEQWFDFLRNALLVLEDNGQVKITVRGREFLLYLVKNGKNKNLPS